MPFHGHGVGQHAQVGEALSCLLPEGIASAVIAGPCDPCLLLPDERRRPDALPAQRLSEFTAGRLCARRAITRLRGRATAIGMLDDDRPRWPPGLTGSITHTRAVSAAAVGECHRFSAIGIDIEAIASMSRELWPYLFLPREIAWIESAPRSQRAAAATLMFSAKESFYKCQYQITRQQFEFQDLVLNAVDDDLSAGRMLALPVGKLAFFERNPQPAVIDYRLLPGMVLTVMTIPSG